MLTFPYRPLPQLLVHSFELFKNVLILQAVQEFYNESEQDLHEAWHATQINAFASAK